MKFLNFFIFVGHFSPSWIRICIPIADPDPADQNQCESGSTTTLHWRMRCGFCRWQKYCEVENILQCVQAREP
jgi:hypothetical protein